MAARPSDRSDPFLDPPLVTFFVCAVVPALIDYLAAIE
jgi:hypothetical protein